MDKNIKLGWVFGFTTAILWAIYTLVMRLGILHIANLHPTTFVLQSVLFAAIALITASGSGALSIGTLRNAFTWQYGTLQIFNNIILMAAFYFLITATSATLLLRSGIVISALFNLLLSGQSKISNKFGFIGICIGLYIVASGVDAETRAIALFFVFLSALTQVMQVRIAATHKQNIQATGDIRTEMRVAGYILAITALAYIAFFTVLAVLELDKFLPNVLPDADSFYSLSSFSLAALNGMLIVSTMKFCEFKSTKLIGSTNFLTAVSCTPVLVFIFETFLSKIGYIAYQRLSIHEIIGGSFIVIGALTLARFSIKPSLNKPTNKEIHENKIAKDLIISTLVHFEQDKEKSCDALDISLLMLNNIYEEEKIYKVRALAKIRHNFESNVRERDPITGLDNRLLFMTQVEKLILKETPFTLMFMDLNKFKEVNDTHGHDVGDEVLKRIAKRLEANYVHVAAITRLGGDEFCMMFHGYDKEQVAAFIPEIKALIKQPITVTDIDSKLSIGVSAGISAFPEDARSSKELFKLADKFMYDDKGNR